MRRKLVVGNWKMHGSRAEIEKLLGDLLGRLPKAPPSGIAVCPPFVYLAFTRQLLANSAIALGAQNVSEESSGAFTGEVAADMLRDCGCEFVIVGHSERRSLYGETDVVVAKKAVVALRHGLTPIVCIGESLVEREAGSTLDVISRQLDAVLQASASDELERIVFAYEPVWAIGKGCAATPEQAQEVHAFVRKRLGEKMSAASIVILYGGSVKADNAVSLFAQPDIDGALVGGASLNAADFAAICAAAE